MKAIKAHLQKTNPDRVAVFEKKAQEFAKKVIGNIKNYDFVSKSIYLCFLILIAIQYTGESMNVEGMVALLNYRVSDLRVLRHPLLILTRFMSLRRTVLLVSGVEGSNG